MLEMKMTLFCILLSEKGENGCKHEITKLTHYLIVSIYNKGIILVT